MRGSSAAVDKYVCSGLYQVKTRASLKQPYRFQIGTRTFRHGQPSLSASVCRDVPSDVHTLSATPRGILATLCSCLLSPLYIFCSSLPLGRAWRQKLFCLFRGSSPQIQRCMAKGISQGCSTWPMTCQRLTCTYLTLGTLKAHFRHRPQSAVHAEYVAWLEPEAIDALGQDFSPCSYFYQNDIPHTLRFPRPQSALRRKSVPAAFCNRRS